MGTRSAADRLRRFGITVAKKADRGGGRRYARGFVSPFLEAGMVSAAAQQLAIAAIHEGQGIAD